MDRRRRASELRRRRVACAAAAAGEWDGDGAEAGGHASGIRREGGLGWDGGRCAWDEGDGCLGGGDAWWGRLCGSLRDEDDLGHGEGGLDGL